MKKVLKFLQSILSGGILTHPKTRSLYPFLLFIAALALLWIANTYAALSIRNDIKKTQETLMSKKTTLAQQEKYYTGNILLSQLVEALAKDSINIAHNATHKIIVNKEGGENE